MGNSAVLVRLAAVGAVTAVAGGVLTGSPVSAHTTLGSPSSSIATPNTSVVLPTPVGSGAVTPRAGKATGLRIKIAGVSAGGRASVRVTGPKQSTRKKAKKYSKVIHGSMTLRVRPGVYRVVATTVAATGGTDVPTMATKTLRVRKNKLTGFLVSYTFVAAVPVPPVVTCASTTVGGTGPGGGTVFFKDLGLAPGRQCLEFAPIGWYPLTAPVDPELAWGLNACASSNVAGTSPAFGTGAANTAAIITACPSAANAPAAWATKNYTSPTGKSDWFLPSQQELDAQCQWARNIANPVATANPGSCSSGSGPLRGGFALVRYLASSQHAANVAWTQRFADGYEYADNKNIARPVRPVRTF